MLYLLAKNAKFCTSRKFPAIRYSDPEYLFVHTLYLVYNTYQLWMGLYYNPPILRWLIGLYIVYM